MERLSRKVKNKSTTFWRKKRRVNFWKRFEAQNELTTQVNWFFSMHAPGIDFPGTNRKVPAKQSEGNILPLPLSPSRQHEPRVQLDWRWNERLWANFLEYPYGTLLGRAFEVPTQNHQSAKRRWRMNLWGYPAKRVEAHCSSTNTTTASTVSIL